jgi:hypothetical protein
LILEDRNTLAFLPSNYGESNSPISVYNSYDLIRKFGLPEDENYKHWFMIYNYLKYQNEIKVVRPISITEKNKVLKIYSDSIPVLDSISDFYNSTIADLTTIEPSDDECFTLIEKNINSNEDIAVVICSSLTNFKDSITDEYVDIISSRTVTDPSTLSPSEQDTYLVPSGAIGDWFQKEGYLAIYDDGWNFVSTTEGSSYYIVDEEIEIYKSGTSFITRAESTSYEYIEYDEHVYIRKIYSSRLQDNDGVIKNWNQIFSSVPDFDNDEFAVIVLKQKSDGLFDMVEKYIVGLTTTADNYYEDLINYISNYIYIKNHGVICDTTNYSLLSNIFKFDGISTDYINVDASDIEDYIDTIDFDDYDFVLNIEFGNSMYYIPEKCTLKNCLCITSAWKEYDTYTDLINDLGIFGTDTEYTTFHRNNLVIGNYKKQYDSYNDKYRLIPFAGDIAGYMMSKIESVYYEITDKIPTIGFEDLILLKENKINIVDIDTKSKTFITSEKFKPKFKYCFNTILHNKITKDVIEIINNNVDVFKPPVVRIQDRIEIPIQNYMNNMLGDIYSYSLDVELDASEDEFSIVLTILYYGLIESIVVNISDYTNFSETMNLRFTNYK